MAAPSLSPAILAARERLRDGRRKLRESHQRGSPGMQLTHLQTDLVDGVILELFDTAVAELGLGEIASQLTLIAHGGYGRRDLAPFSDVDLMLTPLRRVEKLIQPLAARLSRDIVDAGLDLGFSVRTPAQACQWAWKDTTVFTSLSESRFLAGSVHVFGKFFHNLRLGSMRRDRRLIREVYQARRDERRQWGDTVYLLRPNVKRSRGGLRDIQLIRWLGFARYGDTDLEKLVQLGALPREDYVRVRAALAFLLRLRNEMHFDSGRSQDILDRTAQMRIAERWGYQGETGKLPVEVFMQDYFEHTREVRYAAAHFADTIQYRSLSVSSIDMLLSRQIGEDFRVGPYHIWIREKRLAEVSGNVTGVLRLMELANRFERRISHRTWQAIRDAMRGREVGRPDAEAVKQFLSLMDRPGHLADLLRRLHELRVLEQIIPAMRHARCLLQFNEYHKFTVDAHSIRAVEAATQLVHDPGIVGELYREQPKLWLLHLALLIHDLGKGYDRDHSTVGREIARETAQILGLGQADTEALERLVFHHLLMNHVALRHDLTDPKIIEGFASAIGSIEVLEMLLIHSICDLTAVGPDVLTDWKQNLLIELYHRARRFLTESNFPEHIDRQLSETREAVRELLESAAATPAAFSLLDQLSDALIDRADREMLVRDLMTASEISDEDPVRCWGRFCEGQDATEYTVVFRQGERPIGTFMRVTGALLSQGLEIMRSQIETLPSSLAWDRFVVLDPDFAGPPPKARIDDVCRAVAETLRSPSPKPLKFRRIWRGRGGGTADALQMLPCRATFDNSTSERFTIISLFAYDRPGLLYALAQVLAEAELVLHFAKIATHLDQAVDVFYVTELDGSKVEGEARQIEIRNQLIQAAERDR